MIYSLLGKFHPSKVIRGGGGGGGGGGKYQKVEIPPSLILQKCVGLSANK